MTAIVPMPPPEGEDGKAMVRYFVVANLYNRGERDANALYRAEVAALNAVRRYVQRWCEDRIEAVVEQLDEPPASGRDGTDGAA